MQCPRCAHTQSVVTDTRSGEKSIRRRRRCSACRHRFDTIEEILGAPTERMSVEDKRTIQRLLKGVAKRLGVQLSAIPVLGLVRGLTSPNI